MKNLVFCDVDGTIIDNLRGMFKPSPLTQYAFQAMLPESIPFIASGRSKCMLDKNLMALNPRGFVCANGAYAEYDGQVVYEKHFALADLEDIAAFCIKNDINYYFEDQYRIYSLNIHNDLHLAFNNAWQIDDIYVEEDYHDKNIQIIMLACKDEAGCKLVKDKFGGRFDVRHHHGFTSLDINLIGNNKADGIKHIMEYLKVDVSHTYAFGDGLNDIEMLSMVGHGIAMGNAFDEVKAVAKELTDDVLNDGFYKALLRHGLIDAKL